MTFYGSKETVARFVKDLILHFGKDSPSITITCRGGSEDCSVSIVTDTSSEGIVSEKAKTYFSPPTIT